MGSNLERRFYQAIIPLWPPRTPLVVGLSGGIDSMALFALLMALTGLRTSPLVPVHVDHRLRRESGEEAAWLKAYVKDKFLMDLKVVSIEVKPYRGESMEMAARRHRYHVLYQNAEGLGPAARIVVGHQRNDQAETLLMRLIQGTGVSGLAGIPEQNDRIVRPLLGFWRDELKRYLIARDISWIEDASNDDSDIVRNRIRHDLIPRLEVLNPRAQDALAGLADRAQDYREAFRALLESWIEQHNIDLNQDTLWLEPGWQEWPHGIVVAVFLEFAMRRGIRLTRHPIRLTFKGSTNWPSGYVAVHGADGHLRVAPQADPETADDSISAISLPRSGCVVFGGHRVEVTSGIFDGQKNSGWMVVSAQRWESLRARAWMRGDRLKPLGLGGRSKKLQDVFVDAKIPQVQRKAWPVIVGGELPGVILAVPGIVVAEEARAQCGERVFYIRID